MSEGNIIEMEPAESISIPEPSQNVLIFAGQACDGRPSQNTEEMRLKAESLLWLVSLIEASGQTENGDEA